MNAVLDNVGRESWYSAWAIVFLLMGLLFVIIVPHLAMIVFGLPVPLAIALFAFWQGFYRNPNVIAITDQGIELRFRSKKPRYVPWQDVEKIEIPASDPTTFYGKHLAMASLYTKGEASPFALAIEPAKVILDSKTSALGGMP